MPWDTIEDLARSVSGVDKLPKHAQEIFLRAANSYTERHGGEKDADVEAIKRGWGAVRRAGYRKNPDTGTWEKKRGIMQRFKLFEDEQGPDGKFITKKIKAIDDGAFWTYKNVTLIKQGVTNGAMETNEELEKMIKPKTVIIFIDHPGFFSAWDRLGIGYGNNPQLNKEQADWRVMYDLHIFKEYPQTNARVVDEELARHSIEMAADIEWLEHPQLYDGKEYYYIERKMRLINLALMELQDPACSPEDGCSFPQEDDTLDDSDTTETQEKRTLELGPPPTAVVKTEWDTAYINDLPDSAFAAVEQCYKDGKTEDKNARHLPYKDKEGKTDAAHVRNGLARCNQIKAACEDTDIEALKKSARAKLVAAAKDVGVEVEEETTEVPVPDPNKQWQDVILKLTAEKSDLEKQLSASNSLVEKYRPCHEEREAAKKQKIENIKGEIMALEPSFNKEVLDAMDLTALMPLHDVIIKRGKKTDDMYNSMTPAIPQSISPEDFNAMLDKKIFGLKGGK